MTNENIAPSEVTDNVEEERGDAFKGIPKLELLCFLTSFYITVSLNLKNFIYTKLNKNS